MPHRRLLLLACLIAFVLPARAYRMIAPEPFSIVRRDYIKLQLVTEPNDPRADSIFFDVIYNSGSIAHFPIGPSLSHILQLHDFNDGVFQVQARIYHGTSCDTIGSPYDPSGIPIILDRHATYNETIYKTPFFGKSNDQQKIPDAAGLPFQFRCNNNTARFGSHWDEDSLYFQFHIDDHYLNARKPGHTNLFQSRGFLETLWTSDCIEIGFDMNQDRTEWKGKDDYELLVDVQGHHSGNRWSAIDSVYEHWGANTRITVIPQGTLNNNQDTDKGYSISIAIPWKELNYRPASEGNIGFDVQFYDVDGALDESFRTSLSDTNPESNDNTSEWTTLQLTGDETSLSAWWPLFILPAAIIGFILLRRKGARLITPATSTEESSEISRPDYSEIVKKAIEFISAHYMEAELARQQIAEHVFISEKYLSSLFKKETGTNLVAYINSFRVDKAIALLQETRLPISDIGFKVGFNSLQNFNKNFRSVTGKSPSDYRKS